MLRAVSVRGHCDNAGAGGGDSGGGTTRPDGVTVSCCCGPACIGTPAGRTAGDPSSCERDPSALDRSCSFNPEEQDGVSIGNNDDDDNDEDGSSAATTACSAFVACCGHPGGAEKAVAAGLRVNRVRPAGAVELGWSELLGRKIGHNNSISSRTGPSPVPTKEITRVAGT